MSVGLLYFLVIIFANTLGAISGMGGGVLIKPIFDLIGADSLAAISFFSSVAVFTMSIVSTYRQWKNGVRLNLFWLLMIATGSLLGGLVGNVAFERLLERLEDEHQVQLIQIGLTMVSLLFALVYNRYKLKSYHCQSPFSYLTCGFALGFLASFLGIGGGPINVSLLVFLFSMEMRLATVYSIAIIFFSQAAKLLTILTVTGVDAYPLSRLIFIIPAACLGGYLGAMVSKRIRSENLDKVFQLVILLVMGINAYNAWQILG
ncbi:sulfite exporter TauE/SafE family protein [Streptococcus plurextorum]|uniref:sulfite exporter TauE/SafE family protein n=1 Tax=Streptococcus plurextorum TaxID=456876 RepID=UPI0003F58EE7|nr:sulfite exporter TauE/SafE family protein [Streptococcus plurextorum]